MSKTHSFGLCRSRIGRTIFERVTTPLRWASATATIAAVFLAGAATAADVKIPPPAPPAKCVLPDLDAPPGATARCRDGTYSFSRHPREACSRHLGVAEWVMPHRDGKCVLETAP
jgi:hypothetical protein